MCKGKMETFSGLNKYVDNVKKIGDVVNRQPNDVAAAESR